MPGSMLGSLNLETARLAFRLGTRKVHSRLARGIRRPSPIRTLVEEELAAFSRGNDGPLVGRVLLDGMWDNPNYWLRLALTRRALGTSLATEVGLVNIHSQAAARRTFRTLGVGRCVSWERHVLAAGKADQIADDLLAGTREPDDILRWRLPEDFPAGIFYDALLKRQRAPIVGIQHPRFRPDVREGVRSLCAAAAVLDAECPDAMVMSHHIGFSFGGLFWLALRRGIPVMAIYGHHNGLRFFRPRSTEEYFDFMHYPSACQVAALAPPLAETLRASGADYMDRRINGSLTDIGSVYAFQRQTRNNLSRAAVAAQFGWDPARPIIAIYTGNWFDNIHGCGMSHFRDLLDWLRATLDAVERNTQANWLLRGHPCDEWFQSVRLADIMPPLSVLHVQRAPDSWNGADVLNVADGVVSYHSTAGLEYGARGKAVLVADRGWYHDAGFVRWARSREEYLTLLSTKWWTGIDAARQRAAAELFAGYFFAMRTDACRGLWRDDSEGDALYPLIFSQLRNRPEALDADSRLIRDWFVNGGKHLHSFIVEDSRTARLHVRLRWGDPSHSMQVIEGCAGYPGAEPHA